MAKAFIYLVIIICGFLAIMAYIDGVPGQAPNIVEKKIKEISGKPEQVSQPVSPDKIGNEGASSAH